MKKNHFSISFACVLAAFLMTSCFGGVTYRIDNPTNEAIEVSIDGKSPVTVAAKEFKRIDATISKGEHTMKVANGAEIKFTLGENDNHVMLNPTLSTYVIALQEYGIGTTSSDNDTVIEIDGKEYEGPFPLVSNAPFIYTGNVNFQVDAPFKDEITTSKTGTVIMRKVFRKADFIDYYNAEYR
jgi:hypothetical protein